MGASILPTLHIRDVVLVEIGVAALVALALAGVLFLLWRRRRRRRQSFELTLATLVAEVQALAARLEPTPPLERLEGELREAVSANLDTRETMRELVGAIGEYGEHLRSHTAVMQGLAATTVELQRATEGLRLAVGSPEPARAPALDPELLALRGALRARTLHVDELLAELDRTFGEPAG